MSVSTIAVHITKPKQYRPGWVRCDGWLHDICIICQYIGIKTCHFIYNSECGTYLIEY